MLGLDFYMFLLAMVLAIVLLFMMVWHVSCTHVGSGSADNGALYLEFTTFSSLPSS